MEWTQLLTEDILGYSTKTFCTLNIINSSCNYIMLGVVDQKRIKNRSSWAHENSIAFLLWNQSIYANGEQIEPEGAISNQYKTLGMEVQPDKGEIVWSIGGQNYLKKCDLLKQKDIEWVIYLEMFAPGDIVEWQQ